MQCIHPRGWSEGVLRGRGTSWVESGAQDVRSCTLLIWVELRFKKHWYIGECKVKGHQANLYIINMCPSLQGFIWGETN